MARALRYAAYAVIVVIVALAAAFGFVQTRPGKDLLAAGLARLASNERVVWRIEGLGGTVPFAMTARRITLADSDGVWLELRDAAVEIDPAALLDKELRLRLLRIGAWIQTRPPAGPSRPLPELLRLLHAPVVVEIDRLAIARLVLERPVLGAPVTATATGELAFHGAVRGARLELRRIDGEPGEMSLRLSLRGAEPRTELRLNAADPTGLLADRLFQRSDHLPLTLTVKGDGPPSAWHARASVTAGTKARLDATASLALAGETKIGLAAHGAVAALLPAALAAVIGDNATLSLDAATGRGLTVDRLTLKAAFGTLTGHGGWRQDGAVAAQLRAELPDLSRFAALTGAALRGSATIDAVLDGTRSRPRLTAALAAQDVGAPGLLLRRFAARLTAVASAALDDPQLRLAISGDGQADGLELPAAPALTAAIGDRIAWTLTASLDPAAHTLELARIDLRGGAVEITGSGRAASGNNGVVGLLHIAGAARGVRTGTAAADALLGSAPTLAAVLRRDATGIVTLDQLTLAGAAGQLTGTARFDPASRDLRAALAFAVPRLDRLGPALGAGLRGALTAKVTAEGPLDRLRLQAELDGRGLGLGQAAIERMRLSARIADLSQPVAVVDGGFRAGRLDGRLSLAASVVGGDTIAVRDLRFAAASGTLSGDLGVGLRSGLVAGSLDGRFPDLGAWSALAGRPLAGSLNLAARFSADGGRQGLDLTLDGSRLASGAMAIGRLAASARLTDLRGRPSGSGRLSLDAVRAGLVSFTHANATFTGRGPGRFGFEAAADGRPLSLTMAGESALGPGGVELTLARLSGTLDEERFALLQPVTLTRRASELALSRLSLRLGAGQIGGEGRLRGEALQFRLDARDLPLAAGARLLGYANIRGDLAMTAELGGSLRSPRGHLAVTATRIALAVAHDVHTPRLGLAVTGDWDGRALAVSGRVTGLSGDAMAFDGSLPVVLTANPPRLSVPAQGRLALSLRGGGDIGHFAELLPLGEDRLSGKFTVDAALGGTVAAPAASGRLVLSDGRYENFASGAVLTNIAAELVGNGDSFRLVSLSAGDGAGGKVTAAGGLTLGGAAGAAVDLTAQLADFRIAASDELMASASGTVALSGPLDNLRLSAPLTIGHAQITLPNSLPPSVVVLKVTEIGGRAPPPAVSSGAAGPSLPVALDITLRLPGPVLVQGHGLDSQWNGRLRITGTAAAPKISGTLNASRGSYTLLGKSFRVTRGTIYFDGSARIDPALDIVAEASAADVTAEVAIRGFLSAPTVELSSTPALPRDEILARVLFGSGVRQMTAGQGLELAQAAAALSGHDLGVLDRLRGGLGLDWLRLGQGPATAASSSLNPGLATPTAQSTAAISAGKFIAPGVSVGVTQGVSPPTSKVTVEVDLGHHVTVDTEAGQNSGTGIGVNYSYDY
jgi:translocation and assembly module TamB